MFFSLPNIMEGKHIVILIIVIILVILYFNREKFDPSMSVLTNDTRRSDAAFDWSMPPNPSVSHLMRPVHGAYPGQAPGLPWAKQYNRV